MSETPNLVFDFDTASPYSYIASRLLSAFERKHGVRFSWRPVLLGGIFKATGNDMPARIPQKGQYMMRELQELARYHDIPFRFPSEFPPSSLLAQRVLCAWQDEATLPEAASALFEAYWVRDRNITEPEVVAEALGSVHDAPERLVERASDPEVKARLRESTEAAVTAGVFGVPAFHLGDRFWWGHDRLALVAFALRERGEG